MAKIDDRVALGVYHVEDVVAEKLQEVALSGFGPARVKIVFRTFIDEAKLGHETHEACILQLAGEVGTELIIHMQG